MGIIGHLCSFPLAWSHDLPCHRSLATFGDIHVLDDHGLAIAVTDLVKGQQSLLEGLHQPCASI